MVTQTITLSMIPGVTTPRIYASQFDTGLRVFEFNLVDDGGNFSIPTGATVLMNAQKQDGTIISQTCTWVGSKVTADCTTQLSSLAGCVMCEIRVVTTGSTVAGSANFVLYVEPSPIDSGIVSESDINDITELVDEATEAALTAKSFVEDWLEENITQETGYVLDTSLTVSNAAADAKVAGDWIRASFFTDEASGSVASFPDGADGVPVKDLTVSVQAQQSGTGDPSPDNVRPITGWSGAKVVRCGKNILENNVTESKDPNVTIVKNADGSLTINGTLTSTTIVVYNFATNPATAEQNNQIKYIPNGTYHVSTGRNNTDIKIQVVGSNTSGTSGITSIINTNDGEFTIDDTYKYNWVRLYIYAGTYTNVTIYPMIRPSSIADATYEPYNGTTYTVSFGSAGTVYGGTLDITTGVLTATHYMDVLDSTKTYGSSSGTAADSIIMTYNASANAAPSHNESSTIGCISSYLPETSAYTSWRVATPSIAFNSGGTNIWLRLPNVSTKAAGKAYLAANPLTVVYPLATPQTFALTPTQVTSLLGNNNIFADCGGSDVTYRADPRLYLEKLTNPDSDMTADANIASGSYFMVGNRLYLATSAISLGASIVPGTNCTATDLASALNAINA